MITIPHKYTITIDNIGTPNTLWNVFYKNENTEITKSGKEDTLEKATAQALAALNKIVEQENPHEDQS